MWFRRRDTSKALKELIELLTMLEKRISSMEIEVDSLRIRVRKRMFPSKDVEEPEKKGIDDGFDDLRKLNKEHAP